jgi:hypothetical protein
VKIHCVLFDFRISWLYLATKSVAAATSKSLGLSQFGNLIKLCICRKNSL